MRAALWTALLLALPHTAHGVIERMYSFQEVLDECTNVLVGKIERVDRKHRLAVARLERALKGNEEYRQVQMNFSVGQSIEGKYLVELFREGEPFVLFYSRMGDQIASLGHASDVWFQLHATHEGDTSQVWWQFTHIEVYMGRTFSGSTAELLRLADGVLARRRDPPPPDPKVPKFDLRHGPRPGQRRAGAAGPPTVLVPRNAVWRYRKGTAEPAPAGDRGAWRSEGFDDRGWESGRGSFGYGDGPDGTPLDDMRRSGPEAGYSSIYLRGRFEVPDPTSIRNLSFVIDYDDGFILWLNGKRALAANEPAGEPAHDALAAGEHESGVSESFPIDEPGPFLRRGENIVAIQVFNRALTSSDLKIDLEASASIAPPTSKHGRFRPAFTLEAPAGGEVRGISWADADHDGRIDALFCRAGGNVLLLNQAGGWRQAARELGYGEGSRAAGWADCDGDGRADLLTSGFRVLRGAGGKAALGIGLPVPAARNPEGAGWIDCDGDGLPDALITNGAHGVLLYRNRGAEPERFVDRSRAAGLGAGGLGSGNGDFVAFADFDGDGSTDFLYNLGGGLLARNAAGAFAPEARAGLELPGGSAWKRGVGVADYDNDMDFDLFVPSPERPRLYRNDNDGTFTDVLERAGDLAECDAPSFSCAWGDVDQDGFLDLFVCHPGGPGRLYLGERRGRFRAGDGLLPADWPSVHAASFADVDGDGDLDLAVNLDLGVAVALNEVHKAPRHAAVRVQVLARKGLVGAVVRACDLGWRRLGMRQLALAEGCGGQGPPVAHLALPIGPAQVTVCLTDGRVARKTIEVTEKGLALTFREEDLED